MFEVRLYNEHGICEALSNVFDDPVMVQTVLENDEGLYDDGKVESFLDKYSHMKSKWKLEKHFVNTNLFSAIDHYGNKKYLKVVAK